MPEATRLREIFEALGDGLFVADASGRYIDVNPAALQMLGYERDEFLALSLNDILDPAEYQRLAQTVADMADKVLRRSEWRFRRKDGSTFIGELVGGQMPDGTFQSIVRDTTERVERETLDATLGREAAHRTKNVLAVVQAILRQSVSADREGFVPKFEDRLRALASCHDLFVKRGWQKVDLASLVAAQIGPIAGSDNAQLAVSGPEIDLGPSASQALGLALHELATNAAKYGALSVGEGCVDLTWTVEQDDGDGFFSATWRESGGPQVKAPTRTGFGSATMIRMVRLALGREAAAEIDYAPGGVVWTVRCPLAALAE